MRLPSVILATLFAFGSAAAIPVARGASPGVRDDAAMFTSTAVKQVEAKLKDIHTTRGWEVVFQTVETLAGKDIDTLALEKAKLLKVQGLFVLLAEKEHRLSIQAMGRAAAGTFDTSVREELKAKIVAGFKAKQFDRGLTDGVNYLASVAAARPAAVATPGAKPASPAKARAATPPAAEKAEPARPNTARTVLLVVAIVGAVVVAILVLSRMFGRSSAGAGGAGTAEAAGGGRGFFGTLLTGLGGALLGSWLYDRFMRNESLGAEPRHDDTHHPPTAEPPSDYDDYHESTSGDWGDSGGDMGGSDFGGDVGGGDW